jgi:hypothetical protein
MNTLTRRLALRAAAKAALSVTFLGCGGATLAEPIGDAGSDSSATFADASPAKHGDSSAVVRLDSGTTATEASTALACEASALQADAAVPNDTFQCCTTLIGSSLGDSSIPVSLPGPSASDPDTLACCRAIISRIDHDPEPEFETDYESATREILPCCNALTPHEFGRACTPWGPSVPPEMPLLLPLLREVA